MRFILSSQVGFVSISVCVGLIYCVSILGLHRTMGSIWFSYWSQEPLEMVKGPESLICPTKPSTKLQFHGSYDYLSRQAINHGAQWGFATLAGLSRHCLFQIQHHISPYLPKPSLAHSPRKQPIFIVNTSVLIWGELTVAWNLTSLPKIGKL